MYTVKPPHCFMLRDLIDCVSTTDSVECPKHKGAVDLQILVSMHVFIILWYNNV